MQFLRRLILPLICLAGVSLNAQEQEITVTNFSLQENASRFSDGMKGVEFTFDMRFSTYIEDMFLRAFLLNFRLENEQGKSIFDSRDHDNDFNKNIRPDKPFGQAEATWMERTGVKLFVPYREMDLETGAHSLRFILSAKGELTHHADFFEKDIKLKYEKRELRSLAEQEAEVSGFSVLYGVKGFGVVSPGMEISYDLQLKYGMDELLYGDYEQYWQIFSTSGEMVFDSRKASSIHHRKEGLGKNALEGETVREKLFAEYGDIEMDGPGEAEIKIFLEDKSGDNMLAYSWKGLLAIPLKYNFEDQAFTTYNVVAREDSSQGCQGIYIGMTVECKHIGPRKDPEKGNYHLILHINNPVGRAILHHYEITMPVPVTTRVKAEINSMTAPEERFDISFFVPFRLLNLEKGHREIQYRVYATDEKQQAKFPDLYSGELVIQMPERKFAEVSLDELEVVSTNYDTQIHVFGNKKPDLKWFIRVGKDIEFASPREKNSFFAKSGSKVVSFVKGDEISIELWDDDRGLFNRDDLLGRWVIDYEGEEGDFKKKIEKSGLVKIMQYRFKLIP